MFTRTSRYFGLETAELTDAGGRTVVYARRRFLPPLGGAIVLAEHGVVQGDRLDNVTARYLGDPEQFWRVCDANTAMRPADLTAEDRLGAVIVIPLPQAG
jgi:hypothetical protein